MGGTCSAGVCGCPGTIGRDCSGTCRDLASDPANCGTCGRTCGWSCTASTCDDAVEISAGAFHTCARRTSGAVVCWGDNGSGAIGDGGAGGFRLTPVAVVGVSDAVEIAAGGAHTCARRASGTVLCWGWNDHGQLGDGTGGPGRFRATPVAVMGLSDAVEISAGMVHTCARRATGAVVCWGLGGGLLGDGTSGTDRLTPVAVSGLGDAVEITAGPLHTCARRTSGAVVCWGYNGSGALGDGTTTDRLTLVAVTGLSDAVEISAGYGYTCARRGSGTVVCWGGNSYGQLGDGTSGTNRLTPVAVSGLTDALEIAASDRDPYSGESDHTCARRTSGAVVCWGANGSGQIGDGTSGTDRLTPVPVMGLGDAAEITAGKEHTCARRSSGAVVCWGFGLAIGDGGAGGPAHLAPTPVTPP